MERFLSDMPAEVADDLRSVWSDGYQLAAGKVLTPALPAVVILAAYGLLHDTEIVDDFDLLIQRLEDALSISGGCAHPDKYLASCIRLLHRRGLLPSLEAFQMVGIPKIYEELLES